MTTENPHMIVRGARNANDSQLADMTGKAAVSARLCYVDDSRTSAYVVKKLLRPFGYIVDHFELAEPALVALLEKNYDLLITDLKVSAKGMDGDDLVRALRQSGHEKISLTPVIVITGSTDSQVLANVYEAGANQVMTKPVNGEELNTHIRRLVGYLRPAEIGLIPDNGANTAISTDNTQSHSGANVVAFETEAQARRKGSSGAAIASADNIPVLNTVDQTSDETERADKNRYSIDTSTETSAKTPIDSSLGSSYGKESDNNTKSPTDDLGAFFNHPLPTKPHPVVTVKPAARVMPSINIKKPKPLSTASTKLLSTATTQNDAVKRAKLTRQKALQAQLKQAKQQAAAIYQQAKAKQAAVAKRAAEKNKSGQSSVPAQSAIITKKSAMDLHNTKAATFDAMAATLALAPKDSELDETLNQPSQPISAPASDTQPHSESPITALPGAAGSVAVPPPPPRGSANPNHNAPNVDNIIQEMEMYPLVETDSDRGRYSPGRVASAIGSIIELYGPKNLIMTTIFLIATFFLYNTWNTYFGEGTAVEVVVVEQGEIYQSITVPGKIVSKLRVNITPAIAGRLIYVNAEEGDLVKTGALLARLDDREAKSDLKRATSSMKSAKQDVVLAKRSLKKLRQRFSKGVATHQLVKDAEAKLKSARARESIAGEEVGAAKLRLENPRIVASFSGIITARFVEVGQWVVPSETLFTLIDQSQREIEVQVDAADSGGIAVGQTVGLSSDVFPGLEWSESVSRLAAAPNNGSGVGNANTVTVSISLGSHAPSLRIGQQVDADIRTAWNPNALKIPYGAVINRKGASWLALIDNGQVKLVKVATGIEDFSHIEILQGASLGQSVILAKGADLQTGERVFLAQIDR